MIRSSALPLACLLACGGPADSDAPPEADADADADSDADSDADADADSDPPDTDEACAPPPLCQAGQGRAGFEPVGPATPVVMFHGPQGGWHVDVAVRVAGTSSEVVRVRPEIHHLPTGTQLAGADGLLDTYNQALVPTGECGGETWQMAAFFDEVPGLDLSAICALAGGAMEIRIEVTDLAGDVFTCAATGVAALHPSDVEPCASLP